VEKSFSTPKADKFSFRPFEITFELGPRALELVVPPRPSAPQLIGKRLIVLMRPLELRCQAIDPNREVLLMLLERFAQPLHSRELS